VVINISTQQITKEWAVVHAKPDSDFLENLAVRDKGTINSLLGDQNEIWLGQPEVFHLRNFFGEENKHLRKVLEDHDLILIQLSFSFRPAPECEFIRASVKININNKATNVKQKPTAFDMFPKEVVMPITYKRSFSVTPNLKLNFTKVAQLEASAFKLENATEFLIYQPEITAFKGENILGWDFNQTSSRKLIGVKDLFAVIKRERAAPVSLQISISDCYVQTNIIGKVPLSTLILSGGGTLIEKEFMIP
jgi:hypothetical protein